MDHVLHAVLLLVILTALFTAPRSVAVPVVLAAIGIGVATSIAVQRALRAPVRTGNESLIGGIGTVIEWDRRTGLVRHRGELWRATGPGGLSPRQSIRIVQAEGTLLQVRPEDDGNTPYPRNV